MGDMLSLIEKAQEDFDEEQANKLEEKIKKNKKGIRFKVKYMQK
jgi:signal recognition particle subunit SRP54